MLGITEYILLYLFVLGREILNLFSLTAHLQFQMNAREITQLGLKMDLKNFSTTIIYK